MRKALAILSILMVMATASAIEMIAGVVGYRVENLSKETGLKTVENSPSLFLEAKGTNGDIAVFGKEILGDLGVFKTFGQVRIGAEVGFQIFDSDNEIYMDAWLDSSNPLGDYLTVCSKAFFRGYGLCDINGIEDRTDKFSVGMDLSVDLRFRFLHLGIEAGFESWQKPNGKRIIGGFVPSSVRNKIDIYIDMGTERVRGVLQVRYFCDHPEVPWSHNVKVWSNIASLFVVVGIGVAY